MKGERIGEFEELLLLAVWALEEPVYGVLAVKGDTFVDHDDRTVFIMDLDTDVRFVNVPEEEAGKLQRMVRETFPNVRSTSNAYGLTETSSVATVISGQDALDKPTSLIKPVADRLGHDRRYCLDTTKLRTVGWAPTEPFEDGLRRTIEWYRGNEWWWRPIKEQDPAFKAYYQAQYQHRQ